MFVTSKYVILFMYGSVTRDKVKKNYFVDENWSGLTALKLQNSAAGLTIKTRGIICKRAWTLFFIFIVRSIFHRAHVLAGNARRGILRRKGGRRGRYDYNVNARYCSKISRCSRRFCELSSKNKVSRNKRVIFSKFRHSCVPARFPNTLHHKHHPWHSYYTQTHVYFIETRYFNFSRFFLPAI